MTTHTFTLTVDTGRNLTSDDVRDRLFTLLAAGRADMQDTCDDADADQINRDVADEALSLNIRLEPQP